MKPSANEWPGQSFIIHFQAHRRNLLSHKIVIVWHDSQWTNSISSSLKCCRFSGFWILNVPIELKRKIQQWWKMEENLPFFMIPFIVLPVDYYYYLLIHFALCSMMKYSWSSENEAAAQSQQNINWKHVVRLYSVICWYICFAHQWFHLTWSFSFLIQFLL